MELSPAGWIGLYGLLAIAYLAPALVAWMRGHRQTPAIIACNVLFGWTLVGWGITLVWALLRPREHT